MRSWTSAYSLEGTASAESFMSISDWSPLDWTGLTLKTRAEPVELPLPGLVALVGPAATSAAVTAMAVAPKMMRLFICSSSKDLRPAR